MNDGAAERNNGYQIPSDHKRSPSLHDLSQGPALWWSDDINAPYITHPDGLVEFYSPHYLHWKPSHSKVRVVRKYYHFLGWL